MDGDLEESKQKSSKFKEKNFDKSFEKSIFSQGDNELQDLFSRNPDDSQNNTFLNNFTDDNREENDEYKGTSPKIYDNIQSEQNINSFPGFPFSNNTQNFTGNKNNSNSPTQSKTNKLPKKKEANIIIKRNKRKRSPSQNSKRKRHTKYSPDNIRSNITNLILKLIKECINTEIKPKSKIYSKYGGKILITSNDDRRKATIGFYKKFYQKSIKDIFSTNISGRYKSIKEQNHNENLINSLLNDNNEERKQFYEKLFNQKLIDFFKKFKDNTDYIIDGKKLEGFSTFNNIEFKFAKDQKYLDTLKNYLPKFEKLLDIE